MTCRYKHVYVCLQGWEETVDAAVTHLLRTTLAKSTKDQTLNPQALKLPEDTSKVKKHIALLCDKLSKGARLIDGLPMNMNSKFVYKTWLFNSLLYTPCPQQTKSWGHMYLGITLSLYP